MGLFDRSASRLPGRTALLFTADSGEALLDAARLYDPGVRAWHGRLIFRNGILLFGPVTVTPQLEPGHGRKDVPRELVQSAGEATLALASRSGGVAVDVFGFPVTSADDLLPR